MKIIDLKLHIDGLRLRNDESVEDFIKKVEELSDTSYSVIYEVLWEEVVNDES